MSVPNIIEQQMVTELKQLQIHSLCKTTESRRELRRMIDAAEYHLEIYRRCLDEVLTRCGRSPEECTIVDYHGHYGLLSAFAKRLGFGQVIWVGADEESVNLAQTIDKKLNANVDTFVRGDIQTLQKWCQVQGIQPNALLAMNEIDYIYILDSFFATACTLSPKLTMLFTTVATPYNKHVVKRLRRTMHTNEQGRRGKKGFLEQRRDYLQQLYPDMPERQLDYWAEQTRGLNRVDIARAVESQSPNLLQDPYNTCDPATGRWSNRILPIDDYRQLLAPYGKELQVLPGHCNEHLGWLRRCKNHRRNDTIFKAPHQEPANWRERRRMRKALKIAPFIYLIVAPK